MFFLSKVYAGNAPTLRGEYHYSYWGFDIYHAKLFMDKQCVYPNCNFTLELKYQRDFKGTDIAQRSIEEILAQHSIKTKKQKEYTKILKNIFPNVTKGDIITGKMTDDFAEFYLNNKLIGKINDIILSRYFFDIWLSPKTTEPTMRQKLLGI